MFRPARFRTDCRQLVHPYGPEYTGSLAPKPLTGPELPIVERRWKDVPRQRGEVKAGGLEGRSTQGVLGSGSAPRGEALGQSSIHLVIPFPVHYHHRMVSRELLSPLSPPIPMS